jgi:hypothetical protein
VTARYWLTGTGSIPREEAARLVAQLSWRGLGAFPLTASTEHQPRGNG